MTWDAFLQADADYAALFDHRPAVVAVDLHPDFRASRHGAERAEGAGLRLEPVQHHHAHLATCLAENLWPRDGGPVAGIILDGLGLGPDGPVWGGELLLGDYAGFTRHAWLRPAPLIGGDRAQAEPWRNALMRLDQAGVGDWADTLFPTAPRDLARQAAARGINAPLSSSAGRLFDAVAACLGLCPDRQGYEGEGARRLEALARPASGSAALPLPQSGGEIAPAPLFAALHQGLRDGTPVAALAHGFHTALARAFAAPARDLVARGEAAAVALSGGCFQNALLHDLTVAALSGLPVLIHRTTPANDGGLALGQALIAAARQESH